MRIALVNNHGKPLWRVSVQRRSYRKRLFFASYADALEFALATGGPYTIAAPNRSLATTQLR